MVSLLVEIPEELHDSLMGYLETHPDWDQDRMFSAAASLFLIQNRTPSDKKIGRIYLDSLFQRPVEGDAA